MKRLDALEGYPGWYDRIRIRVRKVDGGEDEEEEEEEELTLFIYVNEEMKGLQEIEDGDYRRHLERKGGRVDG